MTSRCFLPIYCCDGGEVRAGAPQGLGLRATSDNPILNIHIDSQTRSLSPTTTVHVPNHSSSYHISPAESSLGNIQIYTPQATGTSLYHIYYPIVRVDCSDYASKGYCSVSVTQGAAIAP